MELQITFRRVPLGSRRLHAVVECASVSYAERYVTRPGHYSWYDSGVRYANTQTAGQVGGHEGVGTVEKLGTNVEEPAVGARVGIKWLAEVCNNCRGEAPFYNLCSQLIRTCSFLPRARRQYMLPPENLGLLHAGHIPAVRCDVCFLRDPYSRERGLRGRSPYSLRRLDCLFRPT